MKSKVFHNLIYIGCFVIILSYITGGAPKSHDVIPEDFDLIIRNGTIYDGSGSPPFIGDIAIKADSITIIASPITVTATTELNATGLVVCPGFINMLSWATVSLTKDGRSMSDILQGVTLEIFGEGRSMGPLNETMKKQALRNQGDIKYDIKWTTLSEYLEYLVKRGISPNVASFVGATTVRIHVLGYEDRSPLPEELEEMRELVRLAMEDGALGVGSSLIYAPAFFASTEELIELAKVASEYDGIYISHIRDEGNQLLKALDELITISREAHIRSEVYHFKVKGEKNWDKLETAIRKIEQARSEGLQITANMYTYRASSTGLNATMPPWVQEGGFQMWVDRLKNPDIRERVQREMSQTAIGWTNNLELAGSADNVLLVGFKSNALKPITGKTLGEVARMRSSTPEETAMDLVIEDSSRVQAVYFVMDEENIRKKVALPWVSFGSDGASLSAEGVFLKSQPHPRAYGNFTRLLGKYVRDEQIVPLEGAIRRLTSLPAENLKIQRRGLLKPGYFADVVVFDPERIQDHATFENPHQLATGIIHVFVNGVQVVKNGQHTGAKPGRVVRGPGWKHISK